MKGLYTALGLLCVGLAVLGVVVPGLPTTPLLLVAAWLFAKSSPRLHQWLLKNKVFGPIIRNWQETRSIPRTAKYSSLVVVGLVAVSSVFFLPHPLAKVAILLVLIWPVTFIYRMTETESLPQKPLDVEVCA